MLTDESTSSGAGRPKKRVKVAPPFTEEQWWILPLTLRQRWWWETGYNKHHQPSPKLVADIKEYLNGRP
jgi:hypothetical protein